MTDRLAVLESKVRALYEEKRPVRADWADWLYETHVFVVADYAREIAERFGGNPELAAAAGMLHDVADAVMKRENPDHHDQSFSMAREMLAESGFTDDEIRIVVDDAIALHPCNPETPHTTEGKAMATGDALGHLATDFYERGKAAMREKGVNEENIRSWALPKIERDFHQKIQYEEVRTEHTSDYEHVKALFA